MIATLLAGLSLLAPPPPLSSADELRVHLCADEPSPIAALDPDTQRRLLRSLRIGEHHVAFGKLGLLEGLPEEDVLPILALFGMEDTLPIVMGLSDGEPRSPRAYPPVPMTPAYCAGAADLSASLDALPIAALERTLQTLDARVWTLPGEAASRAEVGALMTDLYEARLPDGPPPRDLAAADLWTLGSLFGVLATIVEESDHPPAEAALYTVYGEMAARGAAPVADLHKHHLARRDLAAAAALRAAHPAAELAAPPAIRGGVEGRTVLLNGPDGTLVPQPVPTDYTGVLVLTSARCGFSRAADAEIEADPGLAAAMARGVWVVQPRDALADPAILAHNERRPHRPLRHMTDRSEWPMVTRWMTPIFYFLRDGAVVETVEGWPRGEADANRDRLRMGFAAIGQPVD